MTRTTRLFNLLQLLRSRHHPVTASILAAELGISERTLYRDIAELSAQGAPIYGEAGVGYVLRPGLFLPPLMLGEDEIEAVVLGLRYVEQRGDAVLGLAAKEALTKIAAVLPPAIHEIFRNPTALPGPPGQDFPTNAVDLIQLRASARTQMKLDIAYSDAAGNQTERVIWPLALGFMNEARVLIAWCEWRQDYRLFRTDRIAKAEETGERYKTRRDTLLKNWRHQSQGAGEFTPDRN